MPNPVNLKQKLAQLSAAAASSLPRDNGFNGFDSRSPTIAGFKKNLKSVPFNPPWSRRSSESSSPTSYTPGEAEVVQQVITKLIFQAGVDYETRPMVVFNASALPDPKEVSYDLLLTRIMSYLDLYVESDYAVVFFATGVNHTPGWNWVWKAYRSLSRKYRKNLKQLYIVHSSFFSKMLFSLAGSLISPKFFAKIVYIKTLSELATRVPLTQIDIPPAVYKENLKHEREITLPMPTRSSLFGVPLEELMGWDGEKDGLPRVVKDSILFIRERGVYEEGLFRRSPATAMLRSAKEAYDRGHVVSLETFGDPHLAAVLIKKYLRDLPTPVFPESLYPLIYQCPQPTTNPADMASIEYIRGTLLPALPPCTYILLASILHLMHDVSLHADSNKMDAYNLSIVLCPNLVKGTNPAWDVMICAATGVAPPTVAAAFQPLAPPSNASSPSSSQTLGRTTLGSIIYLCIRRYYEIFDEVWDRSEARTYHSGSAQNEIGDSSSSQSSASGYDDDMLVMPLGPTGAVDGHSTLKPKHRSRPSRDSTTRSMHTTFGTGNDEPSSTMANKARSVISIEKGLAGPYGTVGKKGSISVGRSSTRKSSGSGVEALGVTAEGFFTAPKTAPPVPPRWKKPVT